MQKSNPTDEEYKKNQDWKKNIPTGPNPANH